MVFQCLRDLFATVPSRWPALGPVFSSLKRRCALRKRPPVSATAFRRVTPRSRCRRLLGLARHPAPVPRRQVTRVRAPEAPGVASARERAPRRQRSSRLRTCSCVARDPLSRTALACHSPASGCVACSSLSALCHGHRANRRAVARSNTRLHASKTNALANLRTARRSLAYAAVRATHNCVPTILSRYNLPPA